MTQSKILQSRDYLTAQAFARSWNHVFSASPYTDEQIQEWLLPLTSASLAGKKVLELGCGCGGILQYVVRQGVGLAVGLDLGDSIHTAAPNLASYANVRLVQDDLVQPEPLPEAPFDVVYCIGVLHHLKCPRDGFASVLAHTAPGGCFHCWVYAQEGNLVVRALVEPIRQLACQLPWFVNKYLVALPLAVPFFIYAKLCARLANSPRLQRLARHLPLIDYMIWISTREFAFHHHVAFDQLVSPQTTFIPRREIEEWLQDPYIDPDSVYISHRNRNGWKFGGRTRNVNPR